MLVLSVLFTLVLVYIAYQFDEYKDLQAARWNKVEITE